MDHTLPPWQGMLVENNTATGLTIPAGAKVDAGTFHSHDETRLLAFELEGADAATGAPVVDRAAALYLHPDAVGAWDLWDAGKLTPLASAYALLAFEGAATARPC